MERFPKKFSEKTWDTDDELEGDPPDEFSGKKSPAARSIEPNDWSEVLHLKSEDNEKASYIYNTINNKFGRTITWVSGKSSFI